MSERIIMVALQYVQTASPAVPFFYATKSHVSNSNWAWTTDPFYVDGRVIQPGLIERTMYGPGKLRGAAPVGAGAIVLSNADGELDDILTESFDGKPFYVYSVNPETLKVSALLRRGFLEQPTYDDKTITFQCRDALHALDIELLTTKYAGTNALPAGVEGTADDIGGTPKPVLLGTCKNVTPVQVNTSKKIYQLDGVRGFATGYTLAVYDKRAVVTQDGAGDYTSQADMEANNPTAGQYRVWPAGGMFRINFTPAGALTCDVTNPADAASGGVAQLNHVINTLSADVVGLRAPVFSLAGQIYDVTPDVGIYINDTRTVLSAVSELLASAGGFISTGIPLDGTYVASDINTCQLYEPASPFFTPLLSPILITEAELVQGTYPTMVPPSEADRGLPVWRVNVQYAKNWTVMTENDLAGVAAADVAYFTKEYRTAEAHDDDIKDDWPQALELTVTTLIVDAADATAEAQRLLALFKVPRQRLSLRIPRQVIEMGTGGHAPVNFVPGARITLQIPRFGLDAGKTFIVLEMLDNFETDEVALVVWG